MQQEFDDKAKKQLPTDMYYKYEDLHSRPFITPDSEIPVNLLHLSHSFGYDSGRRGNLKLLDEKTLIFIAGNLLVLLDISTKEQRFLRSCSGGGIGAIAMHPTKKYFAVAEKGNKPSIIVYEYPSLRPYRVLRDGTEQKYVSVDFSYDGNLLASVDSAPEYLLTLWDWRQEEVMQTCKAISKEVYRVSFSPYNPELLTTSGLGHIRFWKITTTFTGLKLQGVSCNFESTVETDIEGYVELPDGKVISGTERGNLLLWDGNTVTVEISRTEEQTCHVGTVQPFSLEDGQLRTFGSDGVVLGWDFERINTTNSDSRRFEMDPINKLVVGHNVCLSSVVRSSLPDSFIWFAQDSKGAIWKLDLSFTNTASDPERLFSFHAGEIKGLDVSKKSHLMATTSMDCTVRVFDFLAKRELSSIHFNQGGTTLCWAPSLVNQSGGLLVAGFEDGVVRLLELYNPQSLHVDTGPSPEGNANLCLKKAFKPHNAPVTAVAYERNGEILATGSSDCTVFFFTVGETYKPIGFIQVPGPVQALEWSPHSHPENRLLILCQSGHVVEVQSPDPEAHEKPVKTFQLPDLPSRSFRFKSIKSQIKRDEEIARREVLKEKKRKERENQPEELKLLGGEQEEEDQEKELPPIHIPDPPSPLCCGFYAEPGQFWLSMGGFDSGFLYHCKFSENQDEDPNQRQDEPFDFLPVSESDDDPICSMTFSSNRQLLLCGMNSGSIRVYPLQPGDHRLTSMQAYWALSVHDNHYGHLRHIRCSYDDLFVLTAGDDRNIFTFSLLPPEELQKSLQRKRAKIPSPRGALEKEALAVDIVDPAAYSIETAKQKLENDHLHQEAELKIMETQKQLAELQKTFLEVLKVNQSLPEHVRLKPEELQLDRRFYENAEKLKAQKVMEVRREMAWEQERSTIALRKLQEWFKDSLEINIITVVAIHSNHKISTYHLPPSAKSHTRVRPQSTARQSDGDKEAALESKKTREESAKDSYKTVEDEVLPSPVVRPRMVKLGYRQEERLQKVSKKADEARAKIERRKKEWAQIYAEKPDKDQEDPEDVQAIHEARQNIGDVFKEKKLKVNAERKKEERTALEEKMHEKQIEMNGWIVALRDSKVQLVSWLAAQAKQLQKVQQRLAAHLRHPPPSLPTMLREETPEKRLQCSRATLERYRILREQRFMNGDKEEQAGVVSLLEQLEKEMEAEEKKKKEAVLSVKREGEAGVEKEAELSKLEKELQKEEEILLLQEQDCLLEQMKSSISQFDAALSSLHSQKLCLDRQLKMADLRLVTLSQEILLLKQFETREGLLEEKLCGCIQEEKNIASKLEQCNKELEQKKREIAKLQERVKALTAAFQASLGEHNHFEEFLTRVFKKKIKHIKQKEQTGSDETDSDEDSDDDWDDNYDSSTEEEDVVLDDSVCPAGCEPELFENTLQLRKRRLELEELLAEEKKSAEALNKESDTLMKKEKMVKKSRQVVENDLELINKEKQQKIDELDVVIPLRLDQIEFVVDGSVPSDLSQALVLDETEQQRLHKRIEELEEEKLIQKDLTRQTHKQHIRLIQENKDMAAKIQKMELQCDELMMNKFGKLVDLDALQTQSGNRRLEELRMEKLLIEKANAKEIKQWDAKIKEAQDALMEVTRRNTELLRRMTDLYDQEGELKLKLNDRQKKMGRQQSHSHRRRMDQEEIPKLQKLVKRQSQNIEALKREICLLSYQGGHVLPPSHRRLPPITRLPTPMSDIDVGKENPSKLTQ
ncbi:cilia- and flagella-associated protein 44 isoform X2 [Melanotaenia boesemani]|uniref:cilia- and flagella-associated protein 44 isoform X2 n=1 Tax=Melanotaenia boesemani TaxID=1250792 RepID=UPI001C04F4AC|nr:cilia- and flagella-associated protein 44 isoform X2 [Melanotaenia boesemani]